MNRFQHQILKYRVRVTPPFPSSHSDSETHDSASSWDYNNNNVNTTDSFLTRATLTTCRQSWSLLVTLCMSVTVDSTRLDSTTDHSQQRHFMFVGGCRTKKRASDERFHLSTSIANAPESFVLLIVKCHFTTFIRILCHKSYRLMYHPTPFRLK